MRWQIPAKTFLIGEYIALSGGPALLMTTKPCFTVDLVEHKHQISIPVNSPAWNLCQQEGVNINSLDFSDPYAGIGGMGASSAQFLGAFYACKYLSKQDFSQIDLLSTYLSCAWNGEGVPPSGYDVLAQHLGGCVHIHKNADIYQSSAWPFADIAAVLIHTKKKLATHEHLRNITNLAEHKDLNAIAKDATHAYALGDSKCFVNSINSYGKELAALNLQARHTSTMLADLHKELHILAAKGCGAMGADIILLIVSATNIVEAISHLQKLDYQVLASSCDINFKKNYIFNEKTLDV